MRGGFFGVAWFGEFGIEFVQGFLQLLGFFAQTGGFGGFVDFDFQHQARAVADGDGCVFAFGQGGDLLCFGQAGHHWQVFEVVRQVVRAFDKQRGFYVGLDAHFAAQVADGTNQILQHGHLLEGRLNQTIEQVTQAYETYRFDLAAETLYSFVWNDYCDWYLELAKVQLQTGCASRQRATRHTLLRVLEAALRLLHPIIPFITEELWQTVAPMCDAKTADSIMLARFPEADLGLIEQSPFYRAFNDVGILKEFVGAIRNLRGEMGIQPSIKAPLFIEIENGVDGFKEILAYLPVLTRLTEVQQVAALPENEDAPVAVCNGARLMLKVEIDKAAETARLSKEAEKLQKALDKLNAKLSKPGYVDKAPAHLVEKDKAELAELEEKMGKVQSALAKLK